MGHNQVGNITIFLVFDSNMVQKRASEMMQESKTFFYGVALSIVFVNNISIYET